MLLQKQEILQPFLGLGFERFERVEVYFVLPCMQELLAHIELLSKLLEVQTVPREGQISNKTCLAYE